MRLVSPPRISEVAINSRCVGLQLLVFSYNLLGKALLRGQQ